MYHVVRVASSKNSAFFEDQRERANIFGQSEQHSQQLYAYVRVQIRLVLNSLTMSPEFASGQNRFVKLPHTIYKHNNHGYFQAAQYLRHDKQNIASLVDPSLKSFKNNELMVICEVIEQCLQEDPRKRPTIKESIDKLREAIDVSPNAAVPRLSPLWWAELELLSSEAA